MVRDYISGLMDVNMKVNGNLIKCMGLVNLLGLMKEDNNMKVIILKIKEMVMEYLHGLMEDNMKVTGNKVNNMVKEN